VLKQNPLKRTSVAVIGAFLLAFSGNVYSEEITDAAQLKKDYLVSGLNEKGASFFQQGKWRQALYNFEKSYEINPENDVVRKNLLATYLQVMVEDARKGDWKSVKEDQEKAKKIVQTGEDQTQLWNGIYVLAQIAQKLLPPEEWESVLPALSKDDLPPDVYRPAAVLFHNLAVDALKRKSILVSEAYGKAAVQLDSSFEVYSLLGEIYYGKQELQKARTAWQAALEFKRTPLLETLLQKVEREIETEAQLEEFETENFIVRWNEEEWDKTGRILQIELDRAFETLSKKFDFDPKGKLVVVVYDPDSFFMLDQTRHWVGGFYDGKLRLPFEEGFWERSYEKTLYHELAHAFIYEVTKGKCPVWLNEGLAQVIQNEVDPVSVVIFLAARQAGALFTLREMTQHPEKLRDPIEIGIYYQQSFLITRYLLEQYGWDAMNTLLRKLGEGRPLNKAFFEMTGKDFIKFELEWMASLNK